MLKSEKWQFINDFLTERFWQFCEVAAANMNDTYSSEELI